jgi:hypothetical protein
MTLTVVQYNVNAALGIPGVDSLQEFRLYLRQIIPAPNTE